MFGFLRNKKVKEGSSKLTEEIKMLIDEVAIYPRKRADSERYIIQFPGFTGFILSQESLRLFFHRHYTELTTEQIDRAYRRLETTIRTRFRGIDLPHDVSEHQTRRNWVKDW